MNPKEHRLYQYLSEPVTFAGLSLDEWAVGLAGFVAFMFIPSLFFKGVMGIATVIGIWGMKKVKKWVSGFSLTSFLHWHLGLMKDRPSTCPPSWKRRFLG